MANVTYGARCVNDYSARALDCELLMSNMHEIQMWYSPKKCLPIDSGMWWWYWTKLEITTTNDRNQFAFDTRAPRNRLLELVRLSVVCFEAGREAGERGNWRKTKTDTYHVVAVAAAAAGTSCGGGKIVRQKRYFTRIRVSEPGISKMHIFNMSQLQYTPP